jgi:hypothetical protein
VHSICTRWTTFNMDKLLSHPGFRLIFIDVDSNISLITPLEHKENILENGYRCISHIWGNATRWEDHPIEGVTWGVNLREEKRDKLLQIFNHFKGYWWMDVFCADLDSNNKPFNILENVYGRCKECICMLDIKIPKFLNQSRGTWPNNAVRMVFDHMTEVTECRWNKRVWTLQEWYLPRKIAYTSETFEGDFFTVNPDDVFDTMRFLSEGKTVGLITTAYIMLNIKRYFKVMFLFERDINKESIVHLFIESGRKCMNLEDYYYGIAAILGMHLPDGLSLCDVERAFLSNLEANGNKDLAEKFIRERERFMYG